jgi:hypothetical protein
MAPKRTPLFDALRQRLKDEAKRDDVLVLIFWLLTHFTDEGLIRSPQSPPRKTIVLDGVTYWLVRGAPTAPTPAEAAALNIEGAPSSPGRSASAPAAR